MLRIFSFQKKKRQRKGFSRIRKKKKEELKYGALNVYKASRLFASDR